MSRKLIFVLAFPFVCVGMSNAQTAADPAAANSHKIRDQIARECRKAAADKQLTGEALRAFLAACINPPKDSAN